MNKHNFNSIDKIKTPDEWKAKALNIPCTQIRENDSKPNNFYRLVSSFCITIICLISVFLLIPINDVLQPNNNITENSSHFENTDFESQISKSPTNTQNQVLTSTDNPHIEPTENIKEPTKTYETITLQTQATVIPTSSTSQTPTKPTVIETAKPTEHPTQKPTINHITENVVFSGSVKVEGMWVSSVDAYCKVFDSNGNLLGSNDLYDEQHEAEFLEEINNVEYYHYCASEKGLTFVEGYYTYVFYRRNGSVICSGTQYVS